MITVEIPQIRYKQYKILKISYVQIALNKEADYTSE